MAHYVQRRAARESERKKERERERERVAGENVESSEPTRAGALHQQRWLSPREPLITPRFIVSCAPVVCPCATKN